MNHYIISQIQPALPQAEDQGGNYEHVPACEVRHWDIERWAVIGCCANWKRALIGWWRDRLILPRKQSVEANE